MRSRLVGSKALAKEALARRLLVKEIATGQRGAGQKGADICADVCPRASLGVRQEAVRHCLAARSRNSPTTGLAPMEAKYIRRHRYSLRFQAGSFFLLALLVRLSGKLHDINYNNCLLEQFPTRLFLVLNLAHMPEHSFFPELLAEIRHRGSWETIHCGGQHGP